MPSAFGFRVGSWDQINNNDFRAAFWQVMLRFHVGGAQFPMNRTVYTKRKISLKQQEPPCEPQSPTFNHNNSPDGTT